MSLNLGPNLLPSQEKTYETPDNQKVYNSNNGQYAPDFGFYPPTQKPTIGKLFKIANNQKLCLC